MNFRKVLPRAPRRDQLRGNLDTEYKREVLKVMSDNFAWDTAVPSGTLELVKSTGETVEATLMLMSDVPALLPGHLSSAPKWPIQ